MEEPLTVFLFGDQTYNFGSLLAGLLHVQDDVILSDFIERCNVQVKQSISQLVTEKQELFPRFSKLTDLLPHLSHGRLHPALTQFLTSLCHLGHFIHDHGVGGRPFPNPQTTCLTGLCTGSLSAAAIGAAHSVPDLVPLAVRTTMIAFRTGLRASEVGSSVAAQSSEFASWTIALTVVRQEDIEEKINSFVTRRNLPKTSAPFVTAEMSSTQVAISGPPNILDLFLEEQHFAGKSVAVRLPILAPYHAPHLFSHEDVDEILDCVSPQEGARLTSAVPFFSSSTGLQSITRRFKDALMSAIEEILLQPIRWRALAEGLARYITSRGIMEYNINPIATTGDRSLRSAMAEIFRDTLAPQSAPSYKTTCQPVRVHALSQPASRTKIAIIGISGRLPKAANMDDFWAVLAQGMDVHEVVPPSRWDAKAHVDASLSRKNTSGTGYGCWLDDAASFDARFFNMSPREAPQVDPAQRLALLTATEAMEQAGIVPNRTPSTQKERVGVYFGSTSNDWMETNSAQDIDTYFIPGGNRAFIPGRINYHFKFSGPSYTIDTACSSSFAAIHMACNALWRNEIDTAIVGGTNVLTNPDMTAGLDRGHFLSRTGNCKTFDENADGYCRGEAVVTAILKRLDDAQADKDPIQACIIGIATNHNADADSITRPHVESQRTLFRSLLNETGVDARNISYVELHGTGTQAGDVGETNSVLEIFAPQNADRKRSPEQPLYIGAAKANFGHAESAAGVTSLAKVISMMKNNMIPPHCGIKTKINPKIPDLNTRNTFIANELTPWPRRKGQVRQVFLNNFSAAGGNTALILEDGPEECVVKQLDSRKFHVVAVSAKTPVSLENNIKKLSKWLDKASIACSDDRLLPQVSYTTTARRIHHPHRVMVSGSSLEQINASMAEALEQKQGSTRAKGAPEPIFLFTGQGSQFPGMGNDLYTCFSTFRSDIQRYDRMSGKLGFPTFKILFESLHSEESLSTTLVQLAFVSLQMALCRLWTSLGISARAVVGHSLGEYAALYAAGVLSESDVLYLVGTRAQLLEQCCKSGTHAMLAVRANLSDIQQALQDQTCQYEISCVNGTNSVVLGGKQRAMDEINRILEKKGIKAKLLDVPYAFHTSQVDPMIERLKIVASGVQLCSPKIPILSPAFSTIFHPGDELPRDFVVRHCRDRVDMLGSLRVAKMSGLIHDKVISVELGPAPIVSTMVKEVLGPAVKTFASLQRGHDTWKLLAQALSYLYAMGADIRWSRYHHDFDASHKCLDLPAYSWDLKQYWLQYVHNWSLRKGDPIPRAGGVRLSSSSVHTVVKDMLAARGDTLIVESNLSREDLHPMVQGHKVYGVPLCTPSVYADIALTIGHYLNECFGLGGPARGIDISSMTIQSALVANSHGIEQLLRTTVKVDWTDSSAVCTFSSVGANGHIAEQHSHCTIRFFEKEFRQIEVQSLTSDLTRRMAIVKDQVNSTSNTYRFSKGMIYKMVGQLADFDPNYRGLVEITLDNSELEAVGQISFKNVMKGGDFHTNPAYIDALSQLGGFVMNANEGVNLDKEVFVNHGWDSFQLYEPIEHEKHYTSHVKMYEAPDKLWKGDVTIFSGGTIVARFGGVALQGVPKRLMHYIVNAAGKRVQAPSPQTATNVKPKQSVQPTSSIAAKKTAVKTQKMATNTTMTQIMNILAEESGLAKDDLTDDARLSDIGIDSLLSMVISSRLRDELDIDFQASIFTDFTTVGKIKEYLHNLIGNDSTLQSIEAVQIQTTTAVIESPAAPGDASSGWPSAVTVIAEESGLALEELTDECSFTDIGIDSLLSLVICSRFRDELDLDVPDGSLFVDCPTMGALKEQLYPGSLNSAHDDANAGETPSTVSPTPNDSDTDTSAYSSSSSTESSDVESDEVIKEVLDNKQIQQRTITPTVKPAWSIVLQGMPKRAQKILFLFPDGCGAATSYSKLPIICKSIAVVGFNSPFIKNPTAMSDYALVDIVASYVESLRRHQSHGPYHLGGWSAGGILAYAVAQSLLQCGESVSSLILIDSPAPTKGLDRLPRRFFDHCSSIGLFGTEMNRSDVNKPDTITATRNRHASNQTPEWLIPHFEATINLLNGYKAPKLQLAKSSNHLAVSIIWAGECALDGVRYAKLPPAASKQGGEQGIEDEDTEGMKFLTERRKDFGPGEWADLFPSDHKLNCEVAQDEHHFSMMRGPGADQLVEFLRRALDVSPQRVVERVG